MTTNPEPIQQVIQRVMAIHRPEGEPNEFGQFPPCDGCSEDWPCDPARLARELTATLADVERLRRVEQAARAVLMAGVCDRHDYPTIVCVSLDTFGDLSNALAATQEADR